MSSHLTLVDLDRRSSEINTQRFFKLEDKEFRESISPQTPECKMRAFKGDALIFFGATNWVCKNKKDGDNLGAISTRRKNLIRNEHMSRFMKEMTDVGKFTKLCDFNAHSIATIFEALYYSSHEEDSIGSKEILEEYFAWVEYIGSKDLALLIPNPSNK